MSQFASLSENLSRLLRTVYTAEDESILVNKIVERLSNSPLLYQPKRDLSAADIMFITYGDAFTESGQPPLQTLQQFLDTWMSGLTSTVHILPFFPYTSDDGFAVSDYRSVDPNLGDWSHVEKIKERFGLMFDLVINHASQSHHLFKQFLNNEPPGNRFFTTAPATADVSQVTRPRTSDLLQAFRTNSGIQHVWCTFSRDQVDWDFKNPDVLFEFIDILATYIEKGADWIRLDAIAYLWKELGSVCIHLEPTHTLVKVFRLIAEQLNPNAKILTETNVPNQENLSYFGDGDEAHVIYNFSLPPLVVHALLTGNSTWLSQWCKSLPILPPGCTYLNFTASHDGVGMRPAEGLIPDEELKQVFATLKEAGGLLTYRKRSDGSESPYEVNISLYDAFQGTVKGKDAWQNQRFICSQAIMLSLAGVPAIYYNSILSTPNHHEGVAKTKHNRTINRRKWTLAEASARLQDPQHDAHKVFTTLQKIITKRRQVSAFSPQAEQSCIAVDKRIFAVKRRSQQTGEQVLCLFNLSDESITIDREKFGLSPDKRYLEIISEKMTAVMTLAPYAVSWLAIR